MQKKKNRTFLTVWMRNASWILACSLNTDQVQFYHSWCSFETNKLSFKLEKSKKSQCATEGKSAHARRRRDITKLIFQSAANFTDKCHGEKKQTGRRRDEASAAVSVRWRVANMIHSNASILIEKQIPLSLFVCYKKWPFWCFWQSQ